VLNLHFKNEAFSYTRSGDMDGSQNSKCRSCYPSTTCK